MLYIPDIGLFYRSLVTIFKILLVHSDTYNMRSYYMYKYEKHDKMNMGLQLEQYRKSKI